MSNTESRVKTWPECSTLSVNSQHPLPCSWIICFARARPQQRRSHHSAKPQIRNENIFSHSPPPPRLRSVVEPRLDDKFIQLSVSERNFRIDFATISNGIRNAGVDAGRAGLHVRRRNFGKPPVKCSKVKTCDEERSPPPNPFSLRRPPNEGRELKVLKCRRRRIYSTTHLVAWIHSIR